MCYSLCGFPLSISSGVTGNNVPGLDVCSQLNSFQREKSVGEAGAPKTSIPEKSLNLRQFPRSLTHPRVTPESKKQPNQEVSTLWEAYIEFLDSSLGKKWPERYNYNFHSWYHLAKGETGCPAPKSPLHDLTGIIPSVLPASFLHPFALEREQEMWLPCFLSPLLRGP